MGYKRKGFKKQPKNKKYGKRRPIRQITIPRAGYRM